MVDGSIKKQKKRTVGVTALGWYFILQGWIALGCYSDIGILALVFVALFVCIGIGILKLLRAAYIGALLLSGFILFFSIINFFSILFAPGYFLGLPMAGIIIGAILIFFLTRKGVREQFDENNNKNMSDEEYKKDLKESFLREMVEESANLIQYGIDYLQKMKFYDRGDYCYSLPFLSLSRGYEVLMKCMICFKSYKDNKSYPQCEKIKKYGHDLDKLRKDIVKNYKCVSEEVFKKYPEIIKNDQKYISQKNELINLIKIISNYGKGDRYFELDYVTNCESLYYNETNKKARPRFYLEEMIFDFIAENNNLKIKFLNNQEDIAWSKCINELIIPTLKKFTGALARQFSLGILGEEAMKCNSMSNYSYLKDYKIEKKDIVKL